MTDDKQFLSRAIELAQTGAQKGDGGPFGAVIVREGKIISESWNQVVCNCDPTAHAEVMAIRTACQTDKSFHLANCTLYASSEPCPMCLAAAYWARIERIVFANTRAEAAAIGFCDDELYEELNRHFSARSIIMEHLPIPEAIAPMRFWLNKADRTCY